MAIHKRANCKAGAQREQVFPKLCPAKMIAVGHGYKGCRCMNYYWLFTLRHKISAPSIQRSIRPVLMG